MFITEDSAFERCFALRWHNRAVAFKEQLLCIVLLVVYHLDCFRSHKSSLVAKCLFFMSRGGTIGAGLPKKSKGWLKL